MTNHSENRSQSILQHCYLPCRLSVVGNRFYKQWEVRLFRLCAYFLVLCLFVAGLLLGPIAAGLLYGAYNRDAALYGHRMRSAACYVRALPRPAAQLVCKHIWQGLYHLESAEMQHRGCV